ncbi:hypothetical protein Hanom_Chr01g00022861 [Helianthus anomalus]
MENKNQPTSSLSPPPPPPPLPSSPSFTAELFGDGDSQSSSTGIFTSIFPPDYVATSVFGPSSSFEYRLGSSVFGPEIVASGPSLEDQVMNHICTYV